MNRFTMLTAFVLLGVAVLFAQMSSPAAQSAAPAATPQPSASAGSDNGIRGAFPTTLVKALDSKKLKDGDAVTCETMGPLRSRNGLMIPSGAKIIGHVTQAQARSKGDAQSSLAVVFDKIEVTKGKEIPMKGVLQAVAPSLGGGAGPDTGGMSGSGHMMAGHGDTSTMPSPGGVSGANSGVHPLDAGGGPHPILNAQSQGVLGFKNMQMDNNNVLTSTGKELKLDSGTQMLIRAEIEISVQ